MHHGTLLGTDRSAGASGKRQELGTFPVRELLFLFTPRSLYQSKAKKFSFGKTHVHTYKYKGLGMYSVIEHFHSMHESPCYIYAHPKYYKEK